ncbi:MAG: 3-methyladenine DNA glycosylase [Candidatus Nanopelagicales bacterium]|jgi:hypothetical protein
MRPEEWVPLAQAYATRVEPWIAGRRRRAPRGEKNAVEDFLFDYYPYSPSKLATWHPGYGVTLEGPDAQRYREFTGYRVAGDGVTADAAWLRPRRERLEQTIAILRATASRPAMRGCFALHEWAMTYRLSQEELRHANLPLRVSPAVVARTVEEVGLRCTHLDAYRFFTPPAVPLNALTPTRQTQADNEQPGCVHATMDLYKYAFWFSPLVPSDLVFDCFVAAARARELDMRSSPYDVSRFGLEPIRVETAEGRQEYAVHQRELVESTSPLRERVTETLVALASLA